MVHRQKVVSISSLTTESSCKLSIYSGESASNTAPMFYIYKDSNSSDWRLLPEGNSAAPKLICNLDAEFENKMCSEESSAR